MAAMRGLACTLERTGSLKARRRVQLYNQEEGRLVELPHYEGDAVKEGELLVRLVLIPVLYQLYHLSHQKRHSA